MDPMKNHFTKLSHEALTGLIRKYAMIAADANQVARRLSQLLGVRLRQVRGDYLPQNKAAKAGRLALIDHRYQAVIDEYIRITSYAMEARIRWETHLMLLEARRSTSSFHRAQQQRR